MKIIKLGYVPCVIFFLYCLYSLVTDSYEVVYEKRNGTHPVQFLVCKNLSWLYPEKTEIDLKQLKGDLYDHFNRSKKYEKDRRNRPNRFEELILNRTQSGDYLILNQKICINANDRKELEDIDNFLAPERVWLAIKRDTFDFVQMKSRLELINELTVRKKERPFSDCSSSNSRFHCLNECFKKSFKLSRYFYDSNETGLVQLTYSESNQTIQERNCFSECKRENCKLVQFILVDKSKETKTETIVAQPVLSTFDFWIEIIGLIFSFVGLFFGEFESIAIECTKSRVSRKKVKIVLFYLNLAIILLNLTYCGYLCVRVVFDQQTETNNLPEREMTRNLIYPKIVHLAICVNINKYVESEYGDKTMSEIEGATNGALDDVLEGIYLNYGGRSIRTDHHIHRKVLLKKYHRCFRLTIRPNYEMIPSHPKLAIRLRKYSQLYFLSEEENLNKGSLEYSESLLFKQRTVKRLKSNEKCVNYAEKYANCTGRQNCVERCVNRKFVKKYNQTSFGTHPYQLIDRDWFSPFEWNTSRPMGSSREKGIYNGVEAKCLDEIPNEKPCVDIEFEVTGNNDQPFGQTREIDLQFEVVRSAEELPSSLRMALDLLSIQSIFFGFTALQLFWLVYQFIQPKWRMKHDKIVWFLICLLASIGCSWNTIRMLDVIVNGDLMPAEHYKLAKRVQMPGTIFCMNYDKVDKNHRLTGNYLDELTRMVNLRTFKKIAYLNESNEWTPFDLSRVERFFLLNMKCFRVDTGQWYDRDQFHFSKDTQVLRVDFNSKEDEEIYFMTQSKETAEFSKIIKLDYDWHPMYSITHEASLYEYEDRFSTFRRHSLSFQENDINDLHWQLLELQDNKHNLRTLSLPVKEEHFGLEVNEDLIEQLYSAQQKNKRTKLNNQKQFVVNRLRKSYYYADFSFNLIFLRKVVHSTNEVNYATLTISLLNLLSIWLELGVFDLRPFFVHFHDHLLVYLYLYLPVYLLRKIIKGLLFCYKWLRKIEPGLFEHIDALQKEDEDSPDPAQKEAEEDPSDPPDDSPNSEQLPVRSIT